MYKLIAFAVGLVMSAGLVAAMGWWALAASFGLSLLTVMFSTEREGAAAIPGCMAGTQPAAL